MSGADFAGEAIGLLGGLAGIVALVVEGYTLWIKRKPVMLLFVPYHFTGQDQNKRRLLFALVRLSNNSERPANLYLETLRAEVMFKQRWYQAGVLSLPAGVPLAFDLPDHIQHHAGVRNVSFFNKFENVTITLDKSYSRYLCLLVQDPNIVEGAERLRLEFKDCNLKTYKVEADILKNDPEHFF